MYDDPPPVSPEFLRQNRPLSFVPSPLGDTINPSNRFGNGGRSPPRAHLQRQGSGERVPGVNGINGDARRAALEGLEGNRHETSPGPSPTQILNRQPSDPASQPFEMSLDYSKPEDVAQELSNLQAIRRMSMDVNSQDPDLPSFNPSFRVPAVAPPTHGADEGDPSRLFWVPARLHPELAPKEFKTFIEDKVKTIKRTSTGEDSLLSPDGLSRHGSASGSLRRKKSMLSRQIDSGKNYQDGADRLESQRSSWDRPDGGVGLKELETLVTDPSGLARKMSGEGQRESLDSAVDVSPGTDDAPMFPGQAGQKLRRSTNTQYRRGSVRNRDKLPFSKRLAARQAGGAVSETEDSPVSSPNTEAPPVPHLPLSRVQTEPTSSSAEPLIEKFDFSRPGRKRAPPSTAPGFLGELDFGESAGGEEEFFREQQQSPPANEPNGVRTFQSRIASNPRTTASSIGAVPVPQIVETPPPDPSYPQLVHHPERKSSRSPTSPEPPPTLPPQQPLPNRPRVQQQQQQQQAQQPRPNIPRHAPIQIQQQQQQQQQPGSRTLDDMAAHPSALPGGGTRTDTLSFIPDMPDAKKVEKKKSKEERKWGFFRGKDEHNDRDRREEEAAKRAKAKSPRPGDESSSGRLDVLQQSIDGGKPRESLVLDRNSIRLEEERKKESNRKSGETVKKEKEGIFSGLFSSKKKDKEGSGKGSKQRGLSPEPPMKIMKPDVDYNWTRFSIMEERAIYRMAHIKLANPRRELYSQVLLSNFMYSYLAKVQSQHPQLQVASGQPKQQRPGMKKDSSQQMQQRQQQPEEFSQYQRYQQVSGSSSQELTREINMDQQQQEQQQPQQQDQQQYQQNQTQNPESIEDGPMDIRSDSRGSQGSQYSPQHQQQQQHQSYGAPNGGYGGSNYGSSYGGGGSPVVSSTHEQGGPVNYLGGYAADRSEPLMGDQGDMWR